MRIWNLIALAVLMARVFILEYVFKRQPLDLYILISLIPGLIKLYFLGFSFRKSFRNHHSLYLVLVRRRQVDR
jgi:hypothetical protein